MSGPARSAVIVGGSSGIGAATARLLAGEGFAVHLIARREEPLRDLAGEIGGTYTAADMTDAAESERVARRARRAARRRHLRQPACSARSLPSSTLPVAAWERALAVNLTGAFLFARGRRAEARAGQPRLLPLLGGRQQGPAAPGRLRRVEGRAQPLRRIVSPPRW